jgi:hypothetical protein
MPNLGPKQVRTSGVTESGSCTRLIIGSCNIYNPAKIVRAGFAYHSVGRAGDLRAERKDAL